MGNVEKSVGNVDNLVWKSPLHVDMSEKQEGHRTDCNKKRDSFPVPKSVDEL